MKLNGADISTQRLKEIFDLTCKSEKHNFIGKIFLDKIHGIGIWDFDDLDDALNHYMPDGDEEDCEEQNPYLKYYNGEVGYYECDGCGYEIGDLTLQPDHDLYVNPNDLKKLLEGDKFAKHVERMVSGYQTEESKSRSQAV